MHSNGIARKAERLKQFFKTRRDDIIRNTEPQPPSNPARQETKLHVISVPEVEPSSVDCPSDHPHQETRLDVSEPGSPYRHLDPLQQEIRLLVVKPGRGDDLVDGSFEYACLNKSPKPQYETISYVWGGASVRANIRLEGQDIDVPASSERVLRQFRLFDRTRTLWIDAVCINQADQEERSSQVALMYEIYSCSVKNLIWLGEDNELTGPAINAIRLLVEDMRHETNGFADAADILYNEGGHMRSAVTPLTFSLFDEQIAAISQFYANKWFKRLWVVQEAALASHSICYSGKMQVPLEDVLRAARWIRHKAGSLPPDLSNLNGIIRAVEMFHVCDAQAGRYRLLATHYSEITFLLKYRKFEVSDPRDHVFATLGLARKCFGIDKIPMALQPNYSKSLSEVFRDATIYCIQLRKDLAILGYVEQCSAERLPSGLPTWVPVLDETFDSKSNASNLPYFTFSACSTTRTRLSYSHDTGLTVTGIVIGEAQRVSQPLRKTEIRTMTYIKQTEIYRQVFVASGEDNSASDLPDRLDLAMTLTAAHRDRHQRWSTEDCLNSSIAYDQAREGDDMDSMAKWSADRRETHRLADVFESTISRAARNRCLFSTKHGQLGLGPQTMRADDTVAILYGCRLPVVLRELGPNECRYEFVGVCYVQNVMDGEAVEYHYATGKEDDIFTLV